MSAIATLDGKQYNYLRSKLHILVNKVNTRTTISGFKVCLPSPSLTRNTSYPKNLRVIWIGSFSSFFLPSFFLLTVIICLVLMSQEVTNLIYSYFEKGCRKKCAREYTNMGYDQYTAVPDTVAVEPTFVAFLQHSQTYAHDLSCHSFKFLWRIVNSKLPTIPFGIVACTFFRQPFSK